MADTTTGRASEGGHWYAQNGSCVYEIRATAGQMRPVTLRDARKRGLGTKLTLGQAKEIKALVSAMGWGERRQIAERYGVSAQLLTDIKYGRAWADL